MSSQRKGPEKSKKVLAIVTVDIMASVLLRPWFEGLRDAGFEVHIACARGNYFEGLAADGFIMHPIRFRRTFNPLSHILPFFEIISLLRSQQFQLVNTHSPVAAAVGRLAAAFVDIGRILYTVHGFYFHDRMPMLVRFPLVAIEWFLGRWTDAFMFVSDEDRVTAQRLGICGVNASVCTIYNGVDLDVYRPGSSNQGKELRDRHRLAHGRPVVGIVGRIVREKGHREFLEMAIANTKAGIDATYLVVGDSLPSDRDQFGPLFREYVKQAGLEERFVFTGMTDRVPDYLRVMDVFVLPSYREGFPRSILEAMATGLPVIATDIRGCREAVLDGKTGFIVPPRDSNALRDAAEKLLRAPELRTRMGREARHAAETKYDFRTVKRSFVEFVARVYEGRESGEREGHGTIATRLAVAGSTVLTLLLTLLALYIFPSLLESMIESHVHRAWAFILLGDALGCIVLAFVTGWKWSLLLYLVLSRIETFFWVNGTWSLRQLIWFTNFVPAIVTWICLTPMLLGARNWRRRSAKNPKSIGAGQ